MRSSSHHPLREAPSREDWRFWGALLFSATLIGGLALWALQQEVVDVEVAPIPERILRLVIRDAVVETPPPMAQGDGRARSTRGGKRSATPLQDVPAGSLDGASQAPLSELFRRPVFGGDDLEMDRWDEALALLDLGDPGPTVGAGPGVAGAASGDGRVDAELPELRHFDGPSPEVALASLPERGPSPHRARMLPKLTPETVLPSGVVSHALKAWRRHARSCWTTFGGGWSGRVELRVEVEAGRLAELDIRSRAQLPEALDDCLRVRARRLMTFPAGVTGNARLPFVFE